MSSRLVNSKLALIVIDMQNQFASEGKPILSEVNATIAGARDADVPVIFTQHGHLDPENEMDTSVLVAWWGPSESIRKGSEDWKLLCELDVRSNDIIIDEKTTYDAFYKTPLKSILDENCINTVVISGVLTQFCCETTARSAFVQNYNVIFLSDGTGPAYQATLDTISFGFGKVMTCAEIRSIFNKIKLESCSK